MRIEFTMKKYLKEHWKYLCILFAAAMLLLPSGVVQAAGKTAARYKVTFATNAGKTSDAAFKKLDQTVDAGTSITMPELPGKSDYVGLGWTTKAKSSNVVYKAGVKIKVTNNRTFYAVYRKKRTCTVTFYMGNGSRPSRYKKLDRKVKEGTVIALPSIPSRSGYINVAWKVTLNGKTISYKAGTKIVVNGSYKFTADQRDKLKLVLRYNNGKDYKTYYCGRGLTVKLPAMENPSGQTFMGWSGKKEQFVDKGNTVKYEAGQYVTITKNTYLYAVLFRRSAEQNILPAQFAELNSAKYSSLIFVGDSRTRFGFAALNLEGILAARPTIHEVSAPGQGLSWIKGKGYTLLLDTIRGLQVQDGPPIAVVFNLGVNDLSSAPAYVTYMKQIAPQLKSMNCRLFYMSVNPVNSVQTAVCKNVGTRQEVMVRNFNKEIKSGLSGTYTYLDTYHWLLKTGYSSNRAQLGRDTATDDGLHYAVRTSKRIFDYAVRLLNQA